MNKGYDNAAFFYDALARLVFGNKLKQAQSAFLHVMPQDARVLIVGGGSGWILEEIARMRPRSKLSATYVEASPKMVALTQQRILKSKALDDAPLLINFIATPVQEAQLDGLYDVIITSFFFDNFSNYDAGEITGTLQEHLADNGCWLYADFSNNSSRKHKLLLRIMYLFFGLLCGVKAKALPDMYRIFEKRGFEPVDGKEYMNGFIESAVYIKSIT